MDTMQIGMTEEETKHYTYEGLIDCCGQAVYKFCRRLAYSKEEADDLFQDAFLKAYEQGVSTESMLFTTVLYLWKSKKRKHARRAHIAPTVPLDGNEAAQTHESPEDSVIKREAIRAVREMVETLPEKFKIPIILRYTVEMSVTEIAEAMKIPEGTVKSRLHKARMTIGKGLVTHGYE